MAYRRAQFLRKLASMTIIGVGGSASFVGVSLWNGNERFYRDYVMPFAYALDPEISHRLAVLAMKYCLIGRPKQKDPESLKTELWGLNFPNPIGIAAGFDKNGEAMQGLHRTGFGFVEIGSVTPQPQPGNDKPRVFRLQEDKAIINRYGFNSDGHEAVYERVLAETQKRDRAIIGVNLGKNKLSVSAAEDYIAGVLKFGPIADYLVVNVSSPNTPGLRSLQKKSELQHLISQVMAARNSLQLNKLPPLLLKIAPDLSEEEKEDIASVILQDNCRVDGLIISNTTVSRPGSLASRHKDETGGLSGRPLKEMSTQCIRDMYRLTQGQVPIIGVGGISSGQDAFEKLKAGATLVQLYSSLAYQGPPVARTIKRELHDIITSNGYDSVKDIRQRSV